MLGVRISPFDPNVWSGRAVQEVFVDLADAVLHQCIRLLIGACGAPSHHGCQRTCDLISGQASHGPFGSPVFACAGKTDQRLLTPQPVRPTYFVFLGRISPEKAVDQAIWIAKRCGVPLKIAAKVDAVDRDYFETEIRKLL